MKTKIDVKFEKDKLIVEIIGEVNAQTEFPKLSRGEIKSLVIDLNGLGYMNSGGIKSWVSWITGVNAAFRGALISFLNLPPVSVRQAAQIREFLPNGANIYSFIAPYYCDNCQTSTHITYKKGTNWSSTWEPDEKVRKISYTKCSNCGATIEIDAVPEHYKNF
jgi:hypothetical protein